MYSSSYMSPKQVLLSSLYDFESFAVSWHKFKNMKVFFYWTIEIYSAQTESLPCVILWFFQSLGTLVENIYISLDNNRVYFSIAWGRIKKSNLERQRGLFAESLPESLSKESGFSVLTSKSINNANNVHIISTIFCIIRLMPSTYYLSFSAFTCSNLIKH